MRCTDCTCDIYHYDKVPELDKPGYEVVISGREITVLYQGEEKKTRYTGTDLGHGHYELESADTNGWAMLHRQSPKGLVLEGCWYENGAHGMWRIYLNPRSSLQASTRQNQP